MGLPQGFHQEVIEARENIEGIDFSYSEKPIVKIVDVKPLKPGGSNFKTHILIEKSSSKMKLMAYFPYYVLR